MIKWTTSGFLNSPPICTISSRSGGISDLPTQLQYNAHQNDRFSDSGQWLFHHNTHFIIPHKAPLHIKYEWRDITNGGRLMNGLPLTVRICCLKFPPKSNFASLIIIWMYKMSGSLEEPWSPRVFTPSWQRRRYSGLCGRHSGFSSSKLFFFFNMYHLKLSCSR